MRRRIDLRLTLVFETDRNAMQRSTQLLRRRELSVQFSSFLDCLFKQNLLLISIKAVITTRDRIYVLTLSQTVRGSLCLSGTTDIGCNNSGRRPFSSLNTLHDLASYDNVLSKGKGKAPGCRCTYGPVALRYCSSSALLASSVSMCFKALAIASARASCF